MTLKIQNRRARAGFINLLLVLALIPAITSVITSLATGNEILGAVIGILPAILIIKAFSGEFDLDKLIPLMLIASVLPSVIQQIGSTGNPAADAIVSLLPILVIAEFLK